MKKMEQHILENGHRIVLFRERNLTGCFVSKNYFIEGSKLIEVRLCHSGNKPTYYESGDITSYAKVEKRIRMVFDSQGVLIARRPSPIAPLMLTGKGMGKLLVKRNNQYVKPLH